MSEKILARKTDKHFAYAKTVSVASSSKFAPTVPSNGPITVKFGAAANTATKTKSNGDVLFTSKSHAPGKGPERFVPLESDPKNPVEKAQACYHGHAGTIICPGGKQAPPLPAAIHAGTVVYDGECGERLSVALQGLAAKAGEELKNPVDFYKKYKAAESGVFEKTLAGYKDSLGKAWDFLKSTSEKISNAQNAVLGFIWNYVSNPAARASTNQSVQNAVSNLPNTARDAGMAVVEAHTKLADAVGNAYESAKASAAELMQDAQNLANDLKNLDLTPEKVADALKEALVAQLGKDVCKAADKAEEFLKSDKPLSQSLGEFSGEIQVAVGEEAAVMAVEAGAVLATGGGAAAGVIARRAATTAARVGAQAVSAGASKSPGLLKQMYSKLKKPPQSATKAPTHPSTAKQPAPKPEAAKPTTPPPEKSGAAPAEKKKPDGGPNPVTCPACPTPAIPKAGTAAATKSPVNILLGCKTLSGAEELDFAFPALMPLVWQRVYVSSNPRIGWLGQGWAVPTSVYVETTRAGTQVVDDQGRSVPFEHLAVGQQVFSRFEQFTLHRAGENSYFIKSLDGQIQEFTSRATTKYRRFYLSSQLDRNQNTINYRYDEKTGLLLEVTDSAGRHYVFEFIRLASNKNDNGDRLKAVRLRRDDGTLMPLVSYDYSSDGDLISVRNRNNQVAREFVYKDHLLVKHSQPGGLVAEYEYNSNKPKQARVVRHWDNLGTSYTFEYSKGRSKVTDHLGRTQILLSDKNQERIGNIAYDGSRTHREVDSYRNQTMVSDELGRATRYEYNQQSQITRITQPDGASTTIHYDAETQQVSSVMNALGHSTQFSYDKAGNLVQVIDALKQTTTYELGPNGLPASITDAKGGVVVLAYNAAGQVTRYTDCSQKTTHYRYDNLGNLAEVTNALGQSTRYEYDALDQLVATHQADNTTERYQYNSLGRLIAHTDAAGQTTRYTLHPDGLPAKRTNPLDHNLQYEYDEARRLARLINENGAAYTFSYDVSDLLLQETGFDNKRTQYHYNAAGELVQKTDAPGIPEAITTHYQRDAAGRVLQKRIGKTATQYHYTPLGQLTAVKNAFSHVQLSYDAVGNLTEEASTSHGIATRLTHSYDPLGNRTSTTLPDGRVINHLYYGSGHLHQINVDGQVISDFERDDLHRERQRSQGRLDSHYDYDSLGRLVSQRVARNAASNSAIVTQTPSPAGASQASLLERRYRYDKLGQLTELQDQRSGKLQHTIQYRYDQLGRLEQAGSERFAFDPAHNLIDADGSASATAQVPGRYDNNRLTVYQDKRYTYDAHGNLVLKKTGAHTTLELHWDTDHQLVHSRRTQRANSAAPVVQDTRYAYDAFGRRVSKTDRFGTTHFHWDGNRLLGEQRGSRSLLYLYEPGSFAPLAQLETATVMVTTASTTTAASLPQDAQVDRNTITTAAVASKPAQKASDTAVSTIKLADTPSIHYSDSYEVNSTKKPTQPPKLTASGAGGLQLGGGLSLGSGLSLGNVAPAPIALPTVTAQATPVPAVPTPAPVSDMGSMGGFGVLGNQGGVSLGGGLGPEDTSIKLTAQAPMSAQPPAAPPALLPSPEQLLASIARTDEGKRLSAYLGSSVVDGGLMNLDSITRPSSLPAEPVVPTSETIQRIHYYQNDQLGTPRELTNAEGEIAWSATYQAWGNTLKVQWAQDSADTADTASKTKVKAKETLLPTDLAANDPVHQPVRFQGQYFDSETGLHYNRFRYYDPDVGRFVSQDPIGLAGGDNLYAYAPNPTGWVDPLGLVKKPPYNITMGNTAGQDTLARGVHVNVSGPGIDGKPGHLTITPTTDEKGLTIKPGDAKTKGLSESQLSKACECAANFVNLPNNHSKIAKQAQAGIDAHAGTARAIEMGKVRDLANQGVLVK
jgi:RHS repeat-associated protein